MIRNGVEKEQHGSQPLVRGKLQALYKKNKGNHAKGNFERCEVDASQV
jgi:hypothetical protein